MMETFEKILHERVSDYLRQQSHGKYASPGYWVCAVFLICCLVFLYLYILTADVATFGRLLLVMTFGLCSLLIVFNISHDAIHGALSPKPSINKFFGYTLNLVGGNARSWYLKHNLAHHQHTNIYGKDHDMEMEPIMRISPLSPYKKHYRFQYLYGGVFYMLFALLIIGYVDFLVFYQCRVTGHVLWQPLREWVILLSGKAVYVLYVFIVPVYFYGFAAGDVVTAFLVMHFLNGLILALVFQPSHYFTGAAHFHRNASVTDRGWFRHHLATTVDISPQSSVLNVLLGGLNANVVHHLFPGICHQHFPALAGIVERTAQEFDLPYQKTTLPRAIKSHFLYLKEMGETIVQADA